jgi:Ser/Thr protein kinase RdoA (MazF antagonist)
VNPLYQPILPPEDLAGELSGWDLPEPVGVELIRRGFNDHYRVKAGDENFILRAYQNGKYYVSGRQDYLAELEVLAFLKGEGIPVAAPIPRRDGSLLHDLEREGRTRYLALLEVAPGEEMRGMDSRPVEELGLLVGRLHAALDRYPGRADRHTLDERELIDLPDEILSRQLAARGFDVGYIADLAARLRERTATLTRQPGAWGLIHGDLHGGNAHLDADGSITLFDFDHLGYGWRAYDLAPIRLSLPDEQWQAFLEAYESVRPMSDEERDGISLHALLRRFWDPGDWLRMFLSGIWEDRELKPENWASFDADLRKLAAEAG